MEVIAIKNAGYSEAMKRLKFMENVKKIVKENMYEYAYAG